MIKKLAIFNMLFACGLLLMFNSKPRVDYSVIIRDGHWYRGETGCWMVFTNNLTAEQVSNIFWSTCWHFRDSDKQIDYWMFWEDSYFRSFHQVPKGYTKWDHDNRTELHYEAMRGMHSACKNYAETYEAPNQRSYYRDYNESERCYPAPPVVMTNGVAGHMELDSEDIIN